MIATILNGTPPQGGFSAEVARIALDELAARHWEALHVPLAEMDIAPCRGCFGCWVRSPGECVIADAGRDVARAVIGSDVAVWLTPVTFGGYGSILKRAVDRLIPLISPRFMQIDGEIHHRKRYRRYPRLLALGVLPQADAEAGALFSTLVARNALNLHAPAHVAGLVVAADGPEAARAQISFCLDELEVTG
jgi:hypothetical protein